MIQQGPPVSHFFLGLLFNYTEVYTLKEYWRFSVSTKKSFLKIFFKKIFFLSYLIITVFSLNMTFEQKENCLNTY